MIAYLDLPSGLSGDIFLGCLVDAGWPIERLRTVAGAMVPSDEFAIEARTVLKAGVRATLVDVKAVEGRTDRRLADVIRIIGDADLPAKVKERASGVFTRLAHAEARVHGTTIDQIHFHEVGAVDAIIDIVATIAGLAELSIERVYASAVPLGSGWTRSAHGEIPLPAPATLELLAAARALTRAAPGPGEWVTPTGAALLAELATFEQPPMTIERIGTGAGQRDCAWPNVARLWIGQPQGTSAAMVQLETNIDDMNPQIYAVVSERLFAAGAKDVWFTPIQMKKNRPAILLSVLAAASDEAALTDILLRETTTLGVRVHALQHRHEARREVRKVQTTHGSVGVKLKWVNDEPVGATPEFEDCRALAESTGISVREVLEAATAAAHAMLISLRNDK